MDEVEREAKFHYEKARKAGPLRDKVRTWDQVGEGVRNYYRREIRKQLKREGFEVGESDD